MVKLDHDEAVERARRVQLVITDCDGVLTDNGVYYSAEGEVMKRFSHRDGMGVERLRDADVDTAILTREASEFALRRSEKLKLASTWIGVTDKLGVLTRIEQERGLDRGRLAYIGDDVNDLEIMRAIAPHGLIGAPADAMFEVRDVAHFVSSTRGGFGAFREFAEWVLSLRGKESK